MTTDHAAMAAHLLEAAHNSGSAEAARLNHAEARVQATLALAATQAQIADQLRIANLVALDLTLAENSNYMRGDIKEALGL